MRLGFFLFFVTLPFFAALGYDYFDYQINTSEGFQFNQIGAIWADHLRQSYIDTKNALSPKSWDILLVFLKQPAAPFMFLLAHMIYVFTALIVISRWFFSWYSVVRAEEKQKFETQDIRDLDFLKKNQNKDYKYKYKYRK